MDNLPEELLLQICSHLQIWDKMELSLVSRRFNCLIQETWRDFAVSKGWSNFNGSISWIDACRKYMAYRKKWFTGKYSEYKIYLDNSATNRNQNILTSLVSQKQTIGVGTERNIYCYNMLYNTANERYDIVQSFSKQVNTADNSLCMSDTHVSVVDVLTSELIIIDAINQQESRVQLKFNLVYDICHITANHIILLTDNGEIYLNVIGNNDVKCIHKENEEVSYSCIHDEWQLFVSFWSGKLVAYNILRFTEPILCLELDHVMYSLKVSSNFLYFGTADGDVGRIRLKNPHSTDALCEFKTMHSDSVYCVAINRTTLVSGGSDSKVIFWSLQGQVRYVDHLSHVGVVRHIFLNEWIVITAGDAHVIVVWDPFSYKLKHILHHNPLKVKFMVFNGTSMVYGSPDSNFVIFLSVKH